MGSSMIADPKLELIHQIDAIRDYAKRMVLKGETLSIDEAADLESLMRDFMSIGGDYGLTSKEMVGLVLNQSPKVKRECGCHSCNARKQT